MEKADRLERMFSKFHASQAGRRLENILDLRSSLKKTNFLFKRGQLEENG